MSEIEQRVVSGKGIIRTPETDREKRRIVTLFSEVIRKPTNEYSNFNYSPPKSRYGNLSFVKSGFIYECLPIEFESQAFQFPFDPDGQTLLTLQCVYAGLLQSFANLGTALNLSPITITNGIKKWSPEDLFYDEVRLCCYADTAIRLTLTAIDLLECAGGERDMPPSPPPPDTPPPNYPPGTPLIDTPTPYSEPYDSATDGGLSVPYPDDYLPPEPPSNNYRVAVDVKSGDTLIDTGYTKTFASPNGVPTIVSVSMGGSGYAVVTVSIPGIGNTVLGSTNYNSLCAVGFGTSTGAFVLSTARVESSPCDPV